MRTSAEIRRHFIDYFADRRGHVFAPSSPVVPHDDPTLLFTNAGMNQFKPIFLGQVAPSSDLARLRRAVNSQKCIRAGGKHNDLDDVGKDLYHHTFFEMLGNWSFGDYFKQEAVDWAWDLLVNEWGIDANLLYATYFGGDTGAGLEPDEEARELWLRHLPPERVLPGNMKDNFWEMGDAGPCGPCSEIHIDSRPEAERRSGPPGRDLVNADHPDVIELWNLVFIQFNRASGGLRPLPARHVDTGMGLERITRVLQGVRSNYDTDLFTPIFEKIREITGAPAYAGALDSPRDIAYRVIADHIRTLTFAITDGADPSNEGRGYVLRRILRRAVRHGRQTLGAGGPFLCDLAPTIVELMGGFFPELTKNPRRVADVLREEEESFGRTLDRGIAHFTDAAGAGRISAEDAFKLHDTYGFPIDLTQIMAEERGLTVDVAGFERLMEEARERSRAGGVAGGADPAAALTTDAVASLQKLNIKATDDAAKYDPELRVTSATVRAIWNGADFDERAIPTLISSGTGVPPVRTRLGEPCHPDPSGTGVSPVRSDADSEISSRRHARVAVILDKTSFYAESGGQVGDAGRLVVTKEARASATDKHDGGEFIVEDTRAAAGYVLHVGRVKKGEIRVGDRVECRLDKPRRRAVMANHTGTHLLNFALRETLGEHVDQKGSLVAPDRLRFDFSHTAPISSADAERIESIVRERIARDLAVYAAAAPLADAKKVAGVRAVFGETYPDPVRVVSIGAKVNDLLATPDKGAWRGMSIEFCGGTHVASTAAIGAFVILEESAVAKGVRRLVCLTGDAARAASDAGVELLRRAEAAASLDGAALDAEAHALGARIDAGSVPMTDRASARRAVEALQERIKSARKASAAAGRDSAIDAAREIAANADGVVIVAEIPAGGDRASLLAAMDVVRARRPDAAVMLLSVDAAGGKVSIAAGVPDELIKKGLKAGDWVRAASEACGGKGGGRPDSAQGGGTQIDKLPAAVAAARSFAAPFSAVA